jgi:uncharacterized phage protein gp47/JayE
LTELQSQAVNDIAAALPTGTPLHNSILRILAMAQAGFAHSHYGFLDWIAHQSVPFTATGEFLEAWAALKGVLRSPAAVAQGSATFQGLAGTTIALGTSVQRGDGVTYVTTEEAVVAISGFISVALEAVEAGKSGNAGAGTTLVLSNPITGMQNTATSVSAITGGSDDEDDDSLRTRMNLRYAAPPQGGSQADYVDWAFQVPGVSRAWALGNGAGPGTVIVYTMFDQAQAAHGGFPQGTSGVATLETRDTPATGNQLAIANHIYPLRPVTAIVYAASPQAQAINVTLTNLSPNTTAVRDGIQAALADLYRREGTPLGSTIYPSDINAAIESVQGINRFTLQSPVAPVDTNVGFLPVTGTLSVV